MKNARQIADGMLGGIDPGPALEVDVWPTEDRDYEYLVTGTEDETLARRLIRTFIAENYAEDERRDELLDALDRGDTAIAYDRWHEITRGDGTDDADAAWLKASAPVSSAAGYSVAEDSRPGYRITIHVED
jgi:hypothetical protein